MFSRISRRRGRHSSCKPRQNELRRDAARLKRRVAHRRGRQFVRGLRLHPHQHEEAAGERASGVIKTLSLFEPRRGKGRKYTRGTIEPHDGSPKISFTVQGLAAKSWFANNRTSPTVWKSTSASGASPRHRAYVASMAWSRRDDSARTRREILILTQVAKDRRRPPARFSDSEPRREGHDLGLPRRGAAPPGRARRLHGRRGQGRAVRAPVRAPRPRLPTTLAMRAVRASPIIPRRRPPPVRRCYSVLCNKDAHRPRGTEKTNVTASAAAPSSRHARPDAGTAAASHAHTPPPPALHTPSFGALPIASFVIWYRGSPPTPAFCRKYSALKA